MTAAAGPGDPERDLFERARAGDTAAQGELLERHRTGLLAWVRLKRSALLRDRESTMDAVQSVFRHVLQDLTGLEYRGPAAFRNLLLTYAQNEICNRERRERSDRRSPEREDHAPLSQLYGSICTPSQHLAAKEQVAEFEAAFAHLEEREREIILLARIEELTHDEIAQRLGISLAASKKALSRAVFRLADILARPRSAGS